jgi:holliday junction DNA helicase RuvA
VYTYLKGILKQATPLFAILDVQGVGYLLSIPLSTYAKLPAMGASLLLFVSFVVREDAHRLFGFLREEERDLFETFIALSGIGPKTALALIGHIELCDLQAAIAQGNSTYLCKIPGIGKKTAERLIVEMKDKMGKIFGGKEILPQQKGVSDAISALIHLGYNAAHAQKAVQASLKNSPTEVELSQLITSALRHL